MKEKIVAQTCINSSQLFYQRREKDERLQHTRTAEEGIAKIQGSAKGVR